MSSFNWFYCIPFFDLRKLLQLVLVVDTYELAVGRMLDQVLVGLICALLVDQLCHSTANYILTNCLFQTSNSLSFLSIPHTYLLPRRFILNFWHCHPPAIWLWPEVCRVVPFLRSTKNGSNGNFKINFPKI